MKKNHVLAALLPAMLCWAAAFNGDAVAQPAQAVTNVPAGGEVNLQNVPRMGEDVLGGLTTSRVGENPLKPYFGNTRVCVVPGLWECHAWFSDDGTGIEFYARKKPDGSVELASNAFLYRIVGTPGDYHLCRKPSENGKEICDKYKWEEGHYLYDEWFNNYDRPSEAGFPAYKNIHEHNAIVPGYR